jgi:hypothetical protein
MLYRMDWVHDPRFERSNVSDEIGPNDVDYTITRVQVQKFSVKRRCT